MTLAPLLSEHDCINAEYINIANDQTNLSDRTDHYLNAIRIHDNLLTPDELSLLSQTFDISQFEDNYRDGQYIGTDIPEDDLVYSEFIALLTKSCNHVLALLNYPTIKYVQTRVLISSNTQSPLNKSRHTDDTGSYTHGFTMSYHWFGDADCGGTQFFSNHQSKEPVFKIPFKPNRLAIFPSCIPHEGYAIEGYPNNSKRVIFTLFTVLNDSPRIFNFSKG
jgi:hypothetical protein